MLNILVVDDSLIIRRNLKKHITNLGHNIAGEAKTGVQAVEMCKKLKPEMITMDIAMPDMDGITAVKKIKEFNQEVDIVMVTSNGQEEIVADALRAGAKGYILKPVNKEKLSKAIALLYGEQDSKANEIDDEFLDD